MSLGFPKLGINNQGPLYQKECKDDEDYWVNEWENCMEENNIRYDMCNICLKELTCNNPQNTRINLRKCLPDVLYDNKNKHKQTMMFGVR